MSKTILIAEDHSIMADGYENAISDNTSYTVIGKVVNGKKLLQFLNNKIPDLILLDLNMPEMDGIETAKYVKLKYPNLKVLVISLYFDQQIKTILQNIKVEGYISKTSNAKTLISCINKILKGETVYTKTHSSQKNKNSLEKSDFFRIRFKLSEREFEIIKLIVAGKTSKIIGEDLYLSPLTVETHRKNIFKKTGVSSLGELINWYYKNYDMKK